MAPHHFAHLTVCQLANQHDVEDFYGPPFPLGLAVCSPAHSKSPMLHLKTLK